MSSGRRFWLCASVTLLALFNLGLKPTTPAERAVDILANLANRARPPPPVVPQALSLGGARAFDAKLYVADAPLGRAMVLLHGVHAAGIDEPRIVRFAQNLAGVGVTVLTPELRDLSDYRVTGDGLRVIGESVEYLSKRDDLVPSGRVGLVGFSFAGGLALVAASRPDVASRLEHVMSVGGHHDLERVLRYFLTNEIDSPHGVKHVKAHEYGPVVLLYGALREVAPPADRAQLEAAVSAWLENHRDRARSLAAGLKTSKGKRLFEAVERGDVAPFAPELTAWIQRREANSAALSPKGRLAAIPVPVYLLHGTMDRVIPPSETEFADSELGTRPHRTLITPVIEHVAPEGAGGLFETLAFIDFLALLL